MARLLYDFMTLFPSTELLSCTLFLLYVCIFPLALLSARLCLERACAPKKALKLNLFQFNFHAIWLSNLTAFEWKWTTTKVSLCSHIAKKCACTLRKHPYCTHQKLMHWKYLLLETIASFLTVFSEWQHFSSSFVGCFLFAFYYASCKCDCGWLLLHFETKKIQTKTNKTNHMKYTHVELKTTVKSYDKRRRCEQQQQQKIS